MMRGTRSRCGRLRHGWARPAKRVPAQRSPPPPNHIVPSPPLFGTECVSWHQSRLPGRLNVWALGDSASLLRKSIGAQRYLTIIPSLCASLCIVCASNRAHCAIDFPRRHSAWRLRRLPIWWAMAGCGGFCGVVGGFCDGGADPSCCEVLPGHSPIGLPLHLIFARFLPLGDHRSPPTRHGPTWLAWFPVSPPPGRQGGHEAPCACATSHRATTPFLFVCPL